MTSVFRPRIETLRFRSKQHELAFPTIHPSRFVVLPDDTSGQSAAASIESTTPDMDGY